MNDVIERYVYDVARRLPDKERGEIERELEASIADMLPDEPGEQDILDALAKLGDPRVLAEQYRTQPRYLISPAMFETYITVLKTVLWIVAAVCGCKGALLAVPSGSVGEIIWQGIGMAFEGALQAALWITVGFVIAERAGYKREPWKPADLPPMPKLDGVKISRHSSIAGMVLSVFFTGLLVMMILRDEWFFVFVRGSVVINPFSQTALDRLVPYILLFGCMGLIVNGFKLYWARQNVPLCIINAIHNIVAVSVLIYILYWPDLLSVELIEFTTSFTGDAEALRYINSGMIATFFTVVFIAGAVIDTGTGIWNTVKGSRGSIGVKGA